MKKPYDPIGIQTYDLPACRAVPQPTAPPLDFRLPHHWIEWSNFDRRNTRDVRVSFESFSEVEERIRKLMIKGCLVIKVETRNQTASTDKALALIIRCPTVLTDWVLTAFRSTTGGKLTRAFFIMSNCAPRNSVTLCYWMVTVVIQNTKQYYCLFKPWLCNCDPDSSSDVMGQKVESENFRITVTTRQRTRLFEKNTVFLDVTPCSLVHIYQRLGRIISLVFFG
jgi:hypothetical protein